MKLLVLLGQRKQRYYGEYAVEALAVIDDVGNDDNPEYIEKELENCKMSKEFDALSIVKISISDADVKESLYPSKKVISGKIKE